MGSRKLRAISSALATSGYGEGLVTGSRAWWTKIPVILVGGVLVASSCGTAATQDVTRAAGAVEDCLKPNAVCPNQDFKGMDLSRNDLRGVDFRDSNFDGADLSGVDFTGANLRGGSFQAVVCQLPMDRARCATDLGYNALLPPIESEALEPAIGSGAGFAGDGVAGGATSAKFTNPSALVFTPDSRIAYVADTGNRRVRAIDLTTATVTTIAGSGQPCVWTSASPCGDGAAATGAQLSRPAGLALDESGAKLFVSDREANLIRVIDLEDGTIGSVAGNGRPGGAGDGAPATGASLSAPKGLAVSGTSLYVADSANQKIRSIKLEQDENGDWVGNIDTVAGSGQVCSGGAGTGLLAGPCGIDPVDAKVARLNNPADVAVANSAAGDTLYIADTEDNAIRRVNPAGEMSTVVFEKGNTAVKPTFVDIDKYGGLFMGPLPQGRIGWVAPDKLAALKGRGMEVWSAVPDITAGAGGEKWMSSGNSSWKIPAKTLIGLDGNAAIAPNGRYFISTDPASSKIWVVAARTGPALAGTNFTNADLTPGKSATKISGVIIATAPTASAPTSTQKWDGAKLQYAQISRSRIGEISGLNLQKTVLNDVSIEKVVNSDLTGAYFGTIYPAQPDSRITFDTACMKNTSFTAKTYSKWTVKGSSLAQLRPKPQDTRSISFDRWNVSNSTFDQADSRGSWIFDGGALNNVNFKSTTGDQKQFQLSGTSTEGVYINRYSGQNDRPNYTKTPDGWDPVIADKPCQPEDQQLMSPMSRTGPELSGGPLTFTDLKYNLNFETVLSTDPQGYINGGALIITKPAGEYGEVKDESGQVIRGTPDAEGKYTYGLLEPDQWAPMSVSIGCGTEPGYYGEGSGEGSIISSESLDIRLNNRESQNIVDLTALIWEQRLYFGLSKCSSNKFFTHIDNGRSKPGWYLGTVNERDSGSLRGGIGSDTYAMSFEAVDCPNFPQNPDVSIYGWLIGKVVLRTDSLGRPWSLWSGIELSDETADSLATSYNWKVNFDSFKAIAECYKDKASIVSADGKMVVQRDLSISQEKIIIQLKPGQTASTEQLVSLGSLPVGAGLEIGGAGPGINDFKWEMAIKAADSIGSQPSWNPPQTATKLGDIGPGGGIVFYDAGSAQPWGQYLEVAPDTWSGRLLPEDPTITFCDDVWPDTPWSAWENVGIGSGLKNTDAIAVGCAQGGAYKAARAYHGGRKTDWFVPSKAELNQLCKYIHGESTAAKDKDVPCNGTGQIRAEFSGWSGLSTGHLSSNLNGTYDLLQKLSDGSAFQSIVFPNNRNLPLLSGKVRPIRAFGNQQSEMQPCC